MGPLNHFRGESSVVWTRCTRGQGPGAIGSVRGRRPTASGPRLDAGSWGDAVDVVAERGNTVDAGAFLQRSHRTEGIRRLLSQWDRRRVHESLNAHCASWDALVRIPPGSRETET